MRFFNSRNICRFCAALLLASAILKMFSAIGNHPVLLKSDPVFPFLLKKYVLLMAGIVELIFAILCFGTQSLEKQLMALYFLLSVFSAYRIGLNVSGAAKSCDCLGLFWVDIGFTAHQAYLLGVSVFWLYTISFLVASIMAYREKRIAC